MHYELKNITLDSTLVCSRGEVRICYLHSEADPPECFDTGEDSQQPLLADKDMNWECAFTMTVSLKSLGANTNSPPKTRKSR